MQEQHDEAAPAGHPRDGNGQYIHSIEDAEHDAEAARLRAQGWAYRRIAAHLGISVSTAHTRVERALKETVQEAAAEVRTLELERLDALYVAAMDVLERQHVTVSHGKVIYQGEQPLIDDGPVLAAIDRLLKISERRAKLLGLDSAEKVEVSGGVKYEIVGVDPASLV